MESAKPKTVAPLAVPSKKPMLSHSSLRARHELFGILGPVTRLVDESEAEKDMGKEWID